MRTDKQTQQKYYIKDKASINGKVIDLIILFVQTTCTTVFDGAEHDPAIPKFFRINPEFISLQRPKNQKKNLKKSHYPLQKKILKIF